MLFDAYVLRNICIKNNWFTGGSCEAYDKLFQVCEEGGDFKELALIIWVCTPESDKESIEASLRGEYIRNELRNLVCSLGEDGLCASPEETRNITRKIARRREEYELIGL